MLEARLKDNYRWPSVVLLEGQEYVKNEWRPVPAGREAEAEGKAMLDVRAREAKEPAIEIVVDLSESADAESIADVMGLPAKKAIAKIREAKSLATLEAALEFESDKDKPRSTVIKAIEKRVAELEAEPDEGEGGE